MRYVLSSAVIVRPGHYQYKLLTVAVVIALDVLPYAKAELTNLLGRWMLVPPGIGILFAAFGIFIVNNELRLFANAKVALHSLQDRYLVACTSRPAEVAPSVDAKLCSVFSAPPRVTLKIVPKPFAPPPVVVP